MHEFAITQSIVDIALETLRENHGERLTEIHVGIGNLTGIVEDSLRFYFDALARGTPAEGAGIVVHRRCAVAECSQCGYSGEVEPPFLAVCPSCGQARVRVHGGDALIVERVVLAACEE